MDNVLVLSKELVHVLDLVDTHFHQKTSFYDC